MIVALNDLEVTLGNILNASVQTPVTEKVWITLSPEFGKDAGKTAVIVRILCGLKSAGAPFGATLQSAWNSWVISHVMLTQIYGLNQKSDQKIG